MSMFELSKWKGSQPTLRVVVVLSVLGVASSVIGGCATTTRQSDSALRAGSTPLPSYVPCSPSEFQQEATLFVDMDGLINRRLCLAPGVTAEQKENGRKGGVLRISSDPSHPSPGNICFRRRDQAQGSNTNSPFKTGATERAGFAEVDLLDIGELTLELSATATGAVYDFALKNNNGNCQFPPAGRRGNGASNDGTSGTLEVGTGGTVPPDP